MARYAVAVSFRIGTDRPFSNLQVYIIQAETQSEAEDRGIDYANEFCEKNGEPHGALVDAVATEQIPDVA